MNFNYLKLVVCDYSEEFVLIVMRIKPFSDFLRGLSHEFDLACQDFGGHCTSLRGCSKMFNKKIISGQREMLFFGKCNH